MMTTANLKRQNFNVTPEEEAELNRLRETLAAPNIKEALLRATRVLLTLTQEIQEGRRLYSADRNGKETRLLLPDIEYTQGQVWTYLTSRPHSWKRQLYVKGRRLTAANVWYDMLANRMTLQEAAENWELPLEAIEEIVRYCETHRDLIAMEADEEKYFLQEKGVRLTLRSNA
ncbi:MAG TPA: hypothetical protein VKU00_28445 [Chthonomonadaceae bacterium]|nr:hypothetical protein [Chthonomonadaceae bacterium]